MQQPRGAGEPRIIPLSGAVSLELAWCPPGRFRMGAEPAPGASPASSFEVPAHEVVLTRGFWMGRVPVTTSQWSLVMNVAPPGARAEALPARGMSWHRATEFCRVLTAGLAEAGLLEPGWEIVLPTEAQWEYACRAGTDAAWHFGDDEARLGEHAWYAANSGGELHPVGQKRPNPWGLHDLYGNVSEWCQDATYRYGPDTETDPAHLDPGGAMHLSRGGTCTDHAEACRSASRVFLSSDNPHGEDTGLRVACVPATAATAGS